MTDNPPKYKQLMIFSGFPGSPIKNSDFQRLMTETIGVFRCFHEVNGSQLSMPPFQRAVRGVQRHLAGRRSAPQDCIKVDNHVANKSGQ